VPRPSFTGLRPLSHLCCGLWNSALSLINLGAGLLQPCLPGAAFSAVCVSVGQEITHAARARTTRGGLVHAGKRPRVRFCLRTQSQLLVQLCDAVKDIRPVSPRSSPVFVASGSCCGPRSRLKYCRPQINDRTLSAEQDFASRIFCWCGVSQ